MSEKKIPGTNFKYWSKQEEMDLEHQVRLKTPLDEIAIKHGRSRRAIELRLATMIQKRVKDGSTKPLLMREFVMTPTELEYYLNLNIQSDFKKPQQEEQEHVLKDKIEKLQTRVDKLEKIIKKIYNKIQK